MTYRLKTFRVQFVAEPPQFPSGSPCRSSDDVQRLARAIYGTLDADKLEDYLKTHPFPGHVGIDAKNPAVFGFGDTFTD